MKFAEPNIFIYLIWILPVIALFYVWAVFGRQKLIFKFAEKDLIKKILPDHSIGKMFFIAFLRICSIAFILLALARPQWGAYWEENRSQGFDIMIALDTSRSMLASDIYPDRLEFSKKNIKNFINGLKNDRVGLIAFSGQAFLQCPLTVDRDGLLLVLRSLDTDSIPTGGTSIGEAIEEAIRNYENSAIGEKLLVLVTDGENTSGKLDDILAKAKEQGLVISCIGVGSSTGEQIYISNKEGEREVLRDNKGDIVRTFLDEKTLKKIADETGGIYAKASNESFGLFQAYESLSEKENRSTVKEETISKVYKERFQFFLAVAFLFLMAEMLIEKPKKKGRKI